jgi:hypothetical protein
LFLASGKIVHFRTATMESQAHWMAMLKVVLGKGKSRYYSPQKFLKAWWEGRVCFGWS